MYLDFIYNLLISSTLIRTVNDIFSWQDVILVTFEEDLGKKLTYEMEVAWNKITTFIMVKLIEGMPQAKQQRNVLTPT